MSTNVEGQFISPNDAKPIVGCSADLSTENNLSDIDFIYNRYRAKKKELLMFFLHCLRRPRL